MNVSKADRSTAAINSVLQSARSGVPFFTASNEMIKGGFGNGQFNILAFEFIAEMRQYVGALRILKQRVNMLK